MVIQSHRVVYKGLKGYIYIHIYGELSSLSLISFVQTHPKFKILMSSVTNFVDIYYKVDKALFYQEKLFRETTPKEEKNWNFKKLQKMKIIV